MKFSKKQRNALLKSIKKWEGVAHDGKVERGGNDCKCCEYYSGNGCESCPIRIVTGRVECYNTPYYKWRDHFSIAHSDMGHDPRVICPTCQKHASAMLACLYHILEETNK